MMPRYHQEGLKPSGIKGAIGRLVLGPGNPLDGARVKRLKITPAGSTSCELLEAHGAWARGDRVTVGPGTFRRDEEGPRAGGS